MVKYEQSEKFQQRQRCGHHPASARTSAECPARGPHWRFRRLSGCSLRSVHASPRAILLRRPSCFTPLFKPFHWLPIWLPIKARVLNVALPDPGPASPSHPRPRVRVPLPAWNVLPLPTSFSPLRYWLKPLLGVPLRRALPAHTPPPRSARPGPQLRSRPSPPPPRTRRSGGAVSVLLRERAPVPRLFGTHSVEYVTVKAWESTNHKS